MRDRFAVVNLINSWVGKNEKDGSYKEIIDIYNSYTGKFPRGIKMQYNWAWCAATWSAAAIKLGYTDIMPIEISCGQLVEAAKCMGCWVENDAYVPKVGDAVLYDWDDKGIGDNTGWPDHVGTVTYVNQEAGYFVVTEGNYNDAVRKRTVSLNGKYIRGFIAPKYDETQNTFQELITGDKPIETIAREVISGKWGNGEQRKNQLLLAGYKPEEVQKKVNEILNGAAVITPNPDQAFDQPIEKKVKTSCYAGSFNLSWAGPFVTTANLYCRNDAGSNKKALCLIPKGTKVVCFGYGTIVNGKAWLLIQVNIDGVEYTGFSCSDYLNGTVPIA